MTMWVSGAPKTQRDYLALEQISAYNSQHYILTSLEYGIAAPKVIKKKVASVIYSILGEIVRRDSKR